MTRPRIMFNPWPWLGFGGGCLVVVGGTLIWRLLVVRGAKSQIFTPQPTNFTLQPPSLSLTGGVVKAEGSVERRARGETNFQPLSDQPPLTVAEGEGFRTLTEGHLTLTFPSFITFGLGSDTELNLSNTQPDRLLVVQNQGQVTYTLEKQAAIGIAIRSGIALIKLEGDPAPATPNSINRSSANPSPVGLVTVTAAPEQSQIKVSVEFGRATIALIDDTNTTRTWQLAASQAATIATDRKTVTIAP